MRHADSTGKENRSTARLAYLPLTRRLLILCVTIIFAVGLGGCMGKSEKQIREYLSEKYNGQEFVKISMGTMGYFWGGSKLLRCYPKGGDPQTDEVSVQMYNSKDGERVIMDDYFAILIREDVEADVLTALSDMNLPMKAYCTGTGYFDETYDGTKTYADLKEAILEGEGSWRVNISVFLLCEDIENREQYANQMFDKLSEDGLQRIVAVCVIADTDLYRRCTRKNQNEIFDPNGETMFLFQENLNYD